MSNTPFNKTDYPLVSIITCCYNSESTIVETIESVLAQKYINFELLITDDCSTDNTFEIVQKIRDTDSRIKIFKTNKNSGAAIARNLSIKNASGKYISFLDSDDLWDETKLLNQVNFMEENECAISYGPYRLLKNKSIIGEFYPPKELSYGRLLRQNDIGCLTAMYNVELCGKVYMPEEAIKREDYALWLSILRTGVIAKNYGEILATYRLSNNSVSSKKRKMIKYQYNVFRNIEHLSWIKSHLLIAVNVFNKIFRKY